MANNESSHDRFSVKAPRPSSRPVSSKRVQGSLSDFVKAKTRHLFHPNAPSSSTYACSEASVRSTRTETTCTTASSASTDATDFTMSKQVRFARKAVVRKIPTTSHFSEKEKNDCWFTEEEYASISSDCVKQIKKLESGALLKTKKYCARGIEHHTRLGSIVRLKNRSTSIQAVIEEQDRQFREGEGYDDRKISAAYLRCTSSSQLWANTVGLGDQREAEAQNGEEEDIMNFNPMLKCEATAATAASTTTTDIQRIVRTTQSSNPKPLIPLGYLPPLWRGQCSQSA